MRLKKIILTAASLALITALALPIGGKTFAECNGPTTLAEVNNIILNAGASGDEGDIAINLCADITGPINVSANSLRKFIINLNGFAINPSEYGLAIAMPKNYIDLTIEDTVGTGSVNGRISIANVNNLTITGGTWTKEDPSECVRDEKLAVYKIGDVWKVETRLTGDNVVVDPAEVVFRKGETTTITTKLPAGSTSGVTYSSDKPGVVTVDENGKITAVSTGQAVITVSPTHDTAIKKNIPVAVYDIEAGDGDDEEIAADTVRDLIDQGSPEAKQKEVFGDKYEAVSGALKNAMKDGAVINTRVNIDTSTDKNAIGKINKALEKAGVNPDGIDYYDVTVLLEQNGDLIGNMRKLNKKLTFAITEYSDPEDGYTRKYYIVAYHEGDPTAHILVEGVDYEFGEDGWIYIKSDRFSTFAVATEDILNLTEVKSPDTGAATKEIVSASGSSLTALVAVSILGIFTTVAHGTKKVFSKRK